jgi:hypothetical protein
MYCIIMTTHNLLSPDKIADKKNAINMYVYMYEHI